MHNLRRFWNQNKNQIIKVSGFIIFVFIIIQVFNGIAKNKNILKNQKSENNSNNTILNSDIKNESSKGLLSDQSSVTGKNIKKDQLKSATDTIYNFVTYCNKQDFENAYNLLTDECKKQQYSSVEIFKQTYYADVFKGQKKNCTIENWVGDTYKVNIKEDILATGKDTGYAKQDLMTIKNVDGQNKLNINNYIGYTDINKTTTKNNISIEVVGKNTYKDNEEYILKVTNNTTSVIQLDTVTSTKTLYLEDSNGMKYYYYNHELTDPILTIAVGQTKEINIKFYSTYVSTKSIKKIVFNNIISKNGQLSDILNFTANI